MSATTSTYSSLIEDLSKRVLNYKEKPKPKRKPGRKIKESLYVTEQKPHYLLELKLGPLSKSLFRNGYTTVRRKKTPLELRVERERERINKEIAKMNRKVSMYSRTDVSSYSSSLATARAMTPEEYRNSRMRGMYYGS